ncbi:MAG: sel1 repeat family protein [Flavobacteriales bacterium]|nr:sel1 repeat family protein [Flavobacteriales bacterium]
MDIATINGDSDQNRISQAISNIRTVRNDFIAHSNKQFDLENELPYTPNLTLSEINELYHYTHYVLNKYSQYFDAKKIPMDKEPATSYEKLLKVKIHEERKGKFFVTKDKLKIVEIYKRIADKDEPQYQNDLGCIYEEDEYIDADLIEALKWYLIAESNGDRKATTNQRNVKRKMSREQIEKAKTAASHWLDERRAHR